jgi:hypothetical protein
MGTGTVALPISGLVNVQVSVAAAAAQAQNTRSLLVLTDNIVVDMHTRLLKYSSLSDVAAAFGTNSVEYAVALLWFGQIPTPTDLIIGRWAANPTKGHLAGGPLSSAEQTLSNWTALTGAKFQIAVNGGSQTTIGPTSFASQTNLNGVASQITAALSTASVAATCIWDGTRFVFKTTATGTTASIAFLTPLSGDAADISAQLKAQSGSAGAYLVQGFAAETAAAAINFFDLNYGYQWYAAMVPAGSAADQLACAQAVQAMSTKHFFGATTQDPNTLVAASTTDLAYQMSQLSITKAAVQYSSSSPYAVASLLGRILTTDYTQNSSAITLMYKQEPSVAAEYLNRTQLSAVLAKNCNVFVAYQGGALIIQPGTTCSTNQFIDSVIGLDNLAIDVQLAIFNLLYTSTTKVPQTDAGMNQIVGAAEAILLQYNADGLLGPGIWTDAGFGKLKHGDYMDKGYYIFCPPLSQQSQSDRAARLAGPVKIAVKLAGAVHSVNATIVVNP